MISKRITSSLKVANSLFLIQLCNPCLVAAMPASCQHISQFSQLPKLTTPIRVYGPKDRRAELTKELATKLGFSMSEQSQLNKMIGAIFCPAENGAQMSIGTAFVMGNTKQIYTAGHLLMTKDGRKRDLSKCKFTNYASPRERFDLDANATSNVLPEWGTSVGNGRYDRAKIMLKKEVKGAPPLAADPDAGNLPANHQLLMFSSQHDDFDSTGNRPVLSLCNKSDREEFGGGGTQLKTDCDSSGGGSGAPIIARRNGKLVVEGMNLAQGNQYAAPNAEYDPKTNFQQGRSVEGTGL